MVYEWSHHHYKLHIIVLAQEGCMSDMVILVQEGCMWDIDALVQ